MRNPPPSRAKLLRAGREILLTAGRHVLLKGLTVSAVVERAGISETTFNNNWPTKVRNGVLGGHRKYIDDLLGSLVSDGPRITQDVLADRILQVFGENQGDPRRALRELARWDFEAVRDHPATLTRMLVATLARDHPVAVRSVRLVYDDITRKAARAYSSTLAGWGGEFRRPFTAESIAVVLTSLVEGMTLRWLLDPKAVPDELFGDAVTALVGAVVDVEQRHEHIDDVMEPLSREVIRKYRAEEDRDDPDDPWTAILEAAEGEFAQRGYYTTQLHHIAAAAGVDTAKLTRFFPTKADILEHGLRPVHDDLKRQVSHDALLRRGPEDVVRRHLRRLARAVARHRTWFDALVSLAIQDLARERDEAAARVRAALDFPALIAPALAAGQDAGVFVAVLPPDELATMLTNNVLVRAFSRCEHPPEEVAAAVGAVLLDGILVAP
ncbi:TetR/AcrR family transcriptional regulator [Saccharothrix syringae]|uniref:TetR/AcrR family transcriptional regulator n=1 Tax=Saccharothrix syringae TaxID=103733 RepID=UPI0005267B3E|nr:TetR/AcrR family transcriptional regulator [Saccharothrix syringae]